MIIIYSSPNAGVAQSKNGPFAVDTTIKLQNITATLTASSGLCFDWRSVPVLSDVFVICLSPIAVLTF